MKDEEMKGRDTTQKTKQEALEGQIFFFHVREILKIHFSAQNKQIQTQAMRILEKWF